MTAPFPEKFLQEEVMFTEDLRPGMLVTNHGYAVRLTSFVNDIGDNAYWWTVTLFTDKPEPTMLAFAHHATVKELHTKCA